MSGETRRLDQWLFFARLFKSRSLAADFIAGGAIRLNRRPITKPAQTIRPGDVLTYARGDDVLVIRILAPGERRGPAPEAQALYEVIEEATA